MAGGGGLTLGVRHRRTEPGWGVRSVAVSAAAALAAVLLAIGIERTLDHYLSGILLSQVTARAIADELELGPGVITGTELQHLSDHEVIEWLPSLHVFGRVAPEDKVRLARLISSLSPTFSPVLLPTFTISVFPLTSATRPDTSTLRVGRLAAEVSS